MNTKDKWEIKEELTKLAKRNASNEELLDMLTKKGYNPYDVVECIKEMIHEQLGTDKGRPDEERIKSVMLQMMGYGLSSDKMWEYLDDFKVPEKDRLRLLKEVTNDLKSGKVSIKKRSIYDSFNKPTLNEDDRIICTMCGTDCSSLTKKDRKCPSCDYHMIKIMRDTIIKQGLDKEKVIQGLLESDIFTEEEKDMIR